MPISWVFREHWVAQDEACRASSTGLESHAEEAGDVTFVLKFPR